MVINQKLWYHHALLLSLQNTVKYTSLSKTEFTQSKSRDFFL